MRYKIMVDIAYALAFLHSDCDPPVIHGDIKPSNVLLDADFTARIADFGLARFKYEDDTTVLSGRLSLTRDKTNCEKSNAEAREGRRKMGNLKGGEIVVVDKNPTQEEEEEILECGNEISFSSTELCQEDQKATSESISQEMKTPAMVDAADACKGSPSVDEDETALYGWGKIGQSEELKSEICQISGTEEHLTGSKRNRRLEEYGFGEFILGCVACHSGTGIPVGRDLTAATKKENSGNGNYKATARKEEKRRRVKAGSLEWWKECDGDTNSKEFKKRFRNQLKSKITKNRELTLTENREIKKADSDWWKEDSRNDSCKSMSAESFTFDFSGELNHSMELACHGRGFAKTASREWWSGDLSKGREWWSGEFSSCKKEKNAQGYSWSRELSEDQNQGKKLGRYGSRSTDGWSGDLLSRGMSSTPSMRGTVCYVAPEYTGGGILSEKSDVYSYGVLMLVIISGRRPLQVISSPIHELERANLISWARQAAMAGTMLDLVDGSLQDDFCRDQACFCITLALLCLQKIPSSRPTMQDVVRYLTGEVELPSLPFEFLPSPTGGISPLKPGRKPLVDQNAGQMPIAL
ncbi:hypothetical protein O6H91_09G020800 [Diphasiastrum complanatum]|nr:hypothetical protein O6H91_09G020800 [Diphasiastrum complanatum]